MSEKNILVIALAALIALAGCFIVYNLEESDAVDSTFYLSYSMNGGSPQIATQTWTGDANEHVFTISSTVPTKSGASFRGWSTQYSATTVQYAPGDSIAVSAVADDYMVTLYAVWGEEGTYTCYLYYNANGGMTPPHTQSYTGTSTSPHVFTIASSHPTKSGYVFAGWSESSSASTATYQPGDSISVPYNGSKTLYAVWSDSANTFTLSYSMNGGSPQIPTQTYSGSVSWHLFTISSTVPTKSNVVFLGWALEYGSSDVFYDPGDTIIVSYIDNYSVTLYAVYGEYTCYLYYNANGGSGAPSTQSYSGTSTSSHSFTISSVQPTRSGYTFLGWSESSSASTASYQPGGSISVTYNGSKTLYAVWDAVNYYSLSYIMNGGSPQIPSQSWTGTGSSHTFTISDVQPTRSDYSFRGWSTQYSATTVHYHPGDSVTVTAATDDYSLTLYAVWQQNPQPRTFTLSYSMNGGSPQIATQTWTGTDEDSYHIFTISSIMPSKDGYSFRGWSTQYSATTVHYNPGETINVSWESDSGAAILYAVWGEGTATFWSNDNYNGRVDVLFKYDAADNKSHTMSMDLLTGTVADDQSTTWTDTGYDLSVDVLYPSLTATATLTWTGGTLTKTAALGNWSTFIVSLDTDAGIVSVTPIRTFESFTDYTVYDKQKKTVLDFSDKISGAAVHDIRHKESISGTNSPRFSVVGTSVFLNTFGIVLYNPTINLEDYFPQYESIRVNFYSFALYGESITINGQTWPVDGSKITVQYVSDGSDHYLPGVMPNATVQTRTFELSNIYVTYQDGHCYLTFVNDRFTIDLGAYTPGNETISMQGLWYFATMVYEPYTAIEKHLSDWKILPETDKSQMVLLFLAILVLAGAAVAIHARRSGLGIVDLVIIGAALIFGLVLLG